MSLYQPKQKLAMFVRDLLNQPEGEVVILGRENLRRDDFNALQIVVDSLGKARRLSKAQKYNGVMEKMQHSASWSAPFTINFYGDEAYAQATKFVLLTDSQVGYELQRDMGVGIYLTSELTDVKLLAGEQYSNRFELELNVTFTESATVDVLRIDVAQTDITEG